MKPDIVMQWCVYNDYPIFRRNVQKYRDHINKIIIYPSKQHGTHDFESYAKQVFKETWVKLVPIEYGVEDWRQAETMPCLNHVESDWIWFSEQDFFVDNWDKFYSDVEGAMKTSDAVGWWNDTAFPYFHPCCFFVKTEVFNKTNKDFRCHSEIVGADHFAMISRDLERIGAKMTTLQELGWTNWENAFHLGGLTYPYQDWKNDGTDIFGVGNVEAFYSYNYWSRQVQPSSEEYVTMSREIEQELKKRYPIPVGTEEKWERFFK